MRCLAGEFESALYDECICQRMEAVEPHIMLILNANLYVGIEFLRVGFHQAKQARRALFHPPSFDRCIRHAKLIQTRQTSIS